ncbi:hypothetical protein GOBAR_AA29305 [Gossypium barbadense]|uniref:Uncharacterized protein n=1 Tax=Gossypium barbadense TaxID=3634 RepID=A0A2P5WJW0_GOSBA|nr:hypothetical protein GOBAR_AA29305 [Gossypium barbadense]
MDWCCSSMPRTLEYRTINEERRVKKGKAYWLVIMRPQFLTGGDTKGLCPSIPWIDREGRQSFWDRKPLTISAVLRRLLGSQDRRALILGWAYYLDAFSNYPLRTWSVYRGHDNCPTLGTYYSPRWRRVDIEVPNLPIDSNYYPLSDDPSTRHRQITKAKFRPCSTGRSCSQGPFCLCTRGPIFVWPEETFPCLRYLLGGLRPIETVYLRLSLGL